MKHRLYKVKNSRLSILQFYAKIMNGVTRDKPSVEDVINQYSTERCSHIGFEFRETPDFDNVFDGWCRYDWFDYDVFDEIIEFGVPVT